MIPHFDLILIFAAIGISIALSYKFKLNIGILTLVFSYLIGTFVMGQSVRDIIAHFPYTIVFMLISVSFLNGYALTNGTIPSLANRIVYCTNGRPWLLPWLLWLLTGALTLISSPNAVSLIMAPTAFALCKAAGINPLVGIVAVGTGSMLGSNTPLSQGGLVVRGMLEGFEAYSEQAISIGFRVWFLSLLKDFLAMLCCFILFKGYKANAIQVDKPEKLTKEQRLTCWIMLGVFLTVFVPALLNMALKTPLTKYISNVCDIQMVSIVGAVLCGFLKLGNDRDVIRKAIPWNTIILIIGVCTLMGLAKDAGVVELIAALFRDSVPPIFVPVLMVFLAGALSYFSGAVSVIIPTLMPLVPGLADATGVNIVTLTACVLIGSTSTTLSPFSTGGSVLLGCCPDEQMRDALFVKQVLLAFAIWAGVGLMALVGIFNIGAI